MNHQAHALAVLTLYLASCTGMPTAPVADVRPHEITLHGDTRIDPYYWLNQREDPEVLTYLELENEYTQARMEPTRKLQEELFEELKGRVVEDDESVPVREGDFEYWSRYETGKEYPVYLRKPVDGGAEELLLDSNVMAEGHEYFSVRGRQISPDQNLLAYAVDTVGRRIYDLEIKDLTTGRVVDRVKQISGNIVWAADSKTLFYTRQDLETLRTYQVWRHTLGSEPKGDTLVFQEDDETFFVWVSKTRSKKYLLMGSVQTLSSEVHFLEADQPEGEFQVVLPRERGHEYSVGHHGNHFYVLSNDEAQDFRLMRTPVDRLDRANWEEVVPHRPGTLLEDFDLFSGHLVISERRDGLMHLVVRDLERGGEHEISFDDPAYDVRTGGNPEFDTDTLRFSYTSLTTPDSVYDYNLADRTRDLRKQDEILGEFDPQNYVAERHMAPARDGAMVPISLVRRVDQPEGAAPLLLYGYGSYGSSMDASFSADRLSLLDRGFTFAIAHVRGGQELGRQWYEDGKLLKKRNTFNDFVDCARFLIDEGYTNPRHLYAQGGSAGGLLMGAVINQRPDLFNGVLAAVPFVDVVTTMMDDTIPLTTFEYDEWGNPADSTYYQYMLSYSPYDQVYAANYPHMLVTTGLHDSQVQYFEPAKWVAKLRAEKVGGSMLLLKTNMSAGHGGASGRYKRYEERAFAYAFLIGLERGTL